MTRKKNLATLDFAKIIKVVMFLEFSSDVDSALALADVDRSIGGYSGSGATIYDRVDVIDRNGTPTLWREGLPWEPPANLVLNLAGTPDAPNWEPAENSPRAKQ